ncbi:MAG: hypothetical protein ABL893_14045, partial [Hyphomicrobium sp.]
KARLQFADATIERFPVRKAAISARNRLLYGAGLIDDDRIVSGRDGWLFYKEQFVLYDCGKDDLFDDKIDRMFLVADVARLSSFDYTFAIAPNKATVLPEQMSERTKLYARCYSDRRKHFEQRLAAHGPGNVIDHGLTLKAVAANRRQLFLQSDTHWTMFGASYALRDLAMIGRGAAARDAVASDFAVSPAPGNMVDPDLRVRMLLLSERERDVAAEGVQTFLAKHGAMAGRTVVIHDSFYARISPLVEKLYRDVSLLHVTRDEKKVAAAVRNAQRVVVSGVERSMLNRFYNGPHDWRSPLGQDILTRNSAAAGKCTYRENLAANVAAPVKRASLRNVAFNSGASYAPTTTDPMVIASLDAEAQKQPSVCVRIRLQVDAPSTLTIYPERSLPLAKQALYGHGHSIDVSLQVGVNTIQLIVPTAPSAKTLRIDPVAAKTEFKLLELSLGHPN